MSDPTDPQDAANVEAMEYWDRVVADMEATATEYDGAGWDTLQLHPGDVAALGGEQSSRVGLDVLVPDDEYAELEGMLDGEVAFDAYQVFKAASGSMVFLVVAMEDSESETAVLYPGYYRPVDPAAQAMLDHAHDEGQLLSYVRKLSGEYVVLEHDEPELFAPPEDEGSEADGGEAGGGEADDEE